uniref:uncharacterized protein n=1 Tax=Myxine glutinosa TaxID=7769 RepID=UPI00358F2E80
MDHMLSLMGDKTLNALFRALFRRHLPARVRLALAGSATTEPRAFAAEADKFFVALDMQKVVSVEPQDIPRSLCETICNILLPSFLKKVVSVEPQDIPRPLCETICNILLPSFLKETVPSVPQKNKGVFSYLYNGIHNIVLTSFLKETVPSVPQKIIGVFRYLCNGIHNIVPTSFLKKVVFVEPQDISRSLCETICNIVTTSFLKETVPSVPQKIVGVFRYLYNGIHNIVPTSFLKKPKGNILPTSFQKIEPDTCPWEPSIWSSPKCAPTHWLTPATEIPGNETAYLDDMDVHQCLDFISMEDQEEEMVEINIYEIIFHVVCNSLAIRWIIFCFTKWIKRLKKMYTNKMHHKKRKRRCTCKLESKGATVRSSSWGKVLQDMWARS